MWQLVWIFVISFSYIPLHFADYSDFLPDWTKAICNCFLVNKKQARLYLISNSKLCAHSRGSTASPSRSINSNMAFSLGRDVTWSQSRQEGNSQTLWIQQKRDEISKLWKWGQKDPAGAENMAVMQGSCPGLVRGSHSGGPPPRSLQFDPHYCALFSF